MTRAAWARAGKARLLQIDQAAAPHLLNQRQAGFERDPGGFAATPACRWWRIWAAAAWSIWAVGTAA